MRISGRFWWIGAGAASLMPLELLVILAARNNEAERAPAPPGTPVQWSTIGSDALRISWRPPGRARVLLLAPTGLGADEVFPREDSAASNVKEVDR